jgi:hypothetical protein
VGGQGAVRTRELRECRGIVSSRQKLSWTVPRWIANGEATEEYRRALQVLAREPVGCAEVALLAEGFSVGQLAALAMDGFAKRRPIVTNVGGREKIVVWMQITDAGRAALAD